MRSDVCWGWSRATAAAMLLCAVSSCGGAPLASAEFAAQLQQIRWAAYAPTNYRPDLVPPVLPSDESIQMDVRVLRSYGFNGLITYSAQIPSIPEIAAAGGFGGVLLGVWDPTSEDEIHAVIEAAKSPVVLGIIVGNEGLMTHRYTAEVLNKAMTEVRQKTGKPVSTTEVIESFYTRADLLRWSDFLTINAHPYFHAHRDAASAVAWTVEAWRRIKQYVPDKPMLFKEVGLPTSGAAENSESIQHDYYERLLTDTDVVFAFFEAFDAKFKTGDVEQSWGIFHSDRSAKPAGAILKNTDICSGPFKRPWCGEQVNR